MRFAIRVSAIILGATVVGAAAVAFARPNRYGLSDREERHMLPAVSMGPLDPAWSPDGKLLATGDMIGNVSLWSTATWERQAKLEGNGDWLWSLAFSPDSTLIAGSGTQGTIHLWDTGSGKVVRLLQGKRDDPWGNLVLSVMFSPDGQRVASGNNDRVVRIWDLLPERAGQ